MRRTPYGASWTEQDEAARVRYWRMIDLANALRVFTSPVSEAIKRNPEKSDRAIAAELGVDHKTRRMPNRKLCWRQT